MLSECKENEDRTPKKKKASWFGSAVIINHQKCKSSQTYYQNQVIFCKNIKFTGRLYK